MKRSRRSRGSLTLRSFLLTFALTALACAVTYAAIAYLTPISYTSLLEEELLEKSAALAEALDGRSAEDCMPLLEAFARETGAYLRLTNGGGEVLYDTLPNMDGIAWEGTASLGYAEVTISSYAVEAGDASETQYEGEATYAEQVADFRISETIALADGELGELVVVGGTRAVNQAAEAMKRLLPYLLIVILGISLLGALVYSRLITRPIVELSRIARRMAEQDFDVRWQKRCRDEIGVLGDSLNLLSENLSGALAQLRQANLALQGDIDRERELDRQRTAFFAAASHELKTPVTILKGQLSGMLAQVGVYRDREKYLARALEVTARMEGLIREILTISRIGSGGYALKREQVDLSARMEEVLCQNSELIERRGLRVLREIAPGVTVLGSASLLSNALDNVLMNAILYSPEGATLRVQVSAGELCVINGGASIPDAQLAHLFEPFYRVEQSRNRASGGSGLGLYLVRSILELHGASCGLENSPEGVRFTARFSD
ncbi:MAG: HAMP domain-containing sensor histidine kinase [Eubacteriales bacterium]|nr:HAMP domain-containing sensor histidine kinase [Eubacteriales bacterium]